MAVHPSSPYSSCVLNQHNSSENDGRTNYYGIYGSTPRLVIQGENIAASANYGSGSIFNPYLEDSTAFALVTKPSISNDEDSLFMEVGIVKASESTMTSANLFVAALEKTIQYEAPNGENEHHNVFRASYFDEEGESVDLPANVGDTVWVRGALAVDEEWELSEIFGLAILQDDAKAVMQAESSENQEVVVEPVGVGTIADQELSNAQVFPNPAGEKLTIKQRNGIVSIEIFNLLGELVHSESPNGASLTNLNVSSLTAGPYWLKVTDGEGKSDFTQVVKR